MQRLLAGRWFGFGRLIADYYRSWENSLLRKSDAVVIISPDFRNWLPPEARRDDKTELIMNWGPLQDIECRPKSNPRGARGHNSYRMACVTQAPFI